MYGAFLKIQVNGQVELDLIADKIQADWDSFMKFYGANIKGKYEKPKISQYRNTHQHFINEALQYTNGCTDDF